MKNQTDRKAMMVTAKIKSIAQENHKTKTFELDCSLKSKPGQFCMVWVPGIGEKPFSIMQCNPLSFTVVDVGPVSNALHALKQGDLLTFRGPFGNGFSVSRHGTQDSGPILLVGGGCGTVPLYFLASEARKKGIGVTVIIAAKSEKDLLMEPHFNQAGCHIVLATDDGSKGFKGNAVECAKTEIEKKKFDAVYSCGPEKMMYYLAQLCKEKAVSCELSLERYMKCGMGICGSCAINGMFVCRDGPVFTGEKALSFTEFGKSKRASSGCAVNL